MDATVLATGLHFGEGPRWHHGKLWFSDFYDHAVKTVGMDGRVETKIEVPGQPSGLGWLPDGRMLIVSMLDRTVVRLESERLVVHADLSDVAGFHCNDMVVDPQGRAYVGNFGFDLDDAMATRGAADVLAHHPTAAIALVQPSGAVSVATEGLSFPNGAVITPDGKSFIVAETLAGRLTSFNIGADGSLSKRRTWAELSGRVPDGICLDAEGAIWFANPLAPECVRVSRGGKILQVVGTDQPCYACMLGGPDGRSLFMLTAASSVAAVASQERTGHVLVTHVTAPRAGCP
jgi:sugar lactone lactonase YvrE